MPSIAALMPKRDWRFKAASAIRRYQSKETRVGSTIYHSGGHTFSSIGMWSGPTNRQCCCQTRSIDAEEALEAQSFHPSREYQRKEKRDCNTTQHSRMCFCCQTRCIDAGEGGRRHEDFHPSLEYQSKERHERLKRDTPSLEKVNSEQSKMASRQTGTIAIIIRLIDAREGKDAQCSHP